jgi:phage gpG-like protein
VRYPNQGDPMVSYAGAVQDLASGPNIKPRRFERRPVLVDTNTLRRSLSPANGMLGAGKYWVEVGTNVGERAEANQLGLTTKQAVTPTIKKNLGLWLKKIGKKADGERKKGVITPRTHAQESASQKLVFLFHIDELETQHVARPFLGITPDAERDIQQLMRDFLTKGVA